MSEAPTDPLLVDQYELTMADAYRRDGTAEGSATFSLFVRALPATRGYVVAAGLDPCLSWLEALQFGERELAGLARLGFDDEFLAWLGDIRFTGTVRAMPEGTIAFANEPIVEIEAPLVEGQLAETLLLNQITVGSVLATKAARVRYAAAGRPVSDFALRRVHGVDAGMVLARVCRIVGFAATSNIAGALASGLPASGTMAHSFVQAYDDERAAFRSIARSLRDRTVLLVDTYDTARGVERAIDVAREMRAGGSELLGIRIDSGDLAALSRRAREAFDAAGFPGVQILASGGLDELSIDELVRAGAPIDGFGVGTALGVSADAPSLEAVYKLVAFEGRPVVKTSVGKETMPCAKQVLRDPSFVHDDVLARADEPGPSASHEPLLVEVMRDGKRTDAGRASLADASAVFERGWAALPDAVKDLRSPQCRDAAPSAELQRVTAETRARFNPGVR